MACGRGRKYEWHINTKVLNWRLLFIIWAFLAWVQVKPGSSFGTDPTRRVQVDAPVGRKPIRHSEQWVFGCRQELRLPTCRQTDQATPGSGNLDGWGKKNKRYSNIWRLMWTRLVWISFPGRSMYIIIVLGYYTFCSTVTVFFLKINISLQQSLFEKY